MYYDKISALGAAELKEKFIGSGKVFSSKIEKFIGADEMDVYNPSVPFESRGKTYIAGRMEKRDSEISKVGFFEKTENGWTLDKKASALELQDPFVTFVGGKLVLGGVSVIFPEIKGGDVLWHTDFYIGDDIYSLKKFAEGPKQMKDIRLVELDGGKVAVCSRPQGRSMEKYGCISKIGFTVIDSLSELNAEAIENAPYLEKLFKDDEWGGANQLTVLKNGKIGVIGHKACRTYVGGEQRLHYYGIAFAIDPDSRKITQNKIIVTRDSFPDGEKKRFDLGDVTFTSGIVRKADGTAEIYAGLSDALVGSALIPDPFIEYEK